MAAEAPVFKKLPPLTKKKIFALSSIYPPVLRAPLVPYTAKLRGTDSLGSTINSRAIYPNINTATRTIANARNSRNSRKKKVSYGPATKNNLSAVPYKYRGKNTINPNALPIFGQSKNNARHRAIIAETEAKEIQAEANAAAAAATATQPNDTQPNNFLPKGGRRRKHRSRKHKNRRTRKH